MTAKRRSVANPYYAAATTAYCRRRLIEAALLDPHAIVFFATDGIVSTRPLEGLARVRKQGDVVDLGDWEYCEADSGLFVMPGVYTYGKIVCDQTRGANHKAGDKNPRRRRQEIRSQAQGQPVAH